MRQEMCYAASHVYRISNSKLETGLQALKDASHL